MITYSNDSTVADRDVFVLGQCARAAIDRTVVGFAQSKGVKSVGAIIPTGDLWPAVSSALTCGPPVAQWAFRSRGIETYDRSNTSVSSAVRRLLAKGPADALMIGDSGRIALMAAGACRCPAHA